MTRELSAGRSFGEARRYREAAATLALQKPKGGSFCDFAATRERITSNLRAALAHELWAEHQIGRVWWEHFLVGDRLLLNWQGSELSTFLDAIRAVAA